MKFTKQAEYAVVLVGRLAEARKPVSLSVMAKESNLSYSLLRKVAHLLQKKGMILGKEGVFGGYVLTGDADKMRLMSVLSAVGEEMYSCGCGCRDGSGCIEETAVCPKNSVLNNVGKMFSQVCDNITLADLNNKKISCVNIGDKNAKCKI